MVNVRQEKQKDSRVNPRRICSPDELVGRGPHSSIEMKGGPNKNGK